LALIGRVDRTDGYAFDSLGEQIINNPLLFSRSPIGCDSEIDIDVGDVGNSLLRAFARDSPEIGGIVGYKGELMAFAGSALLPSRRLRIRPSDRLRV
jgi:hypothetical protein